MNFSNLGSNGPPDQLPDCPLFLQNHDNNNSNCIDGSNIINNNNLPSDHITPNQYNICQQQITQQSQYPRFANAQSSPTLSITDDVISFASLNVRGINNNTKFESILDDFLSNNISVIGLQETKLKESIASNMFKAYTQHNCAHNNYKAYWSHDTK